MVVTGTFSKEGDSGGLIVPAHGEFVGLLTGGAGKGTNGFIDITCATPFEWVWELVLNEFSGANLDFDDDDDDDDLEALFADVVA